VMQQRCHHASASARSPSWPPMPRPRLQRAATARREKIQLRIREQSFFALPLARARRALRRPAGRQLRTACRAQGGPAHEQAPSRRTHFCTRAGASRRPPPQNLGQRQRPALPALKGSIERVCCLLVLN
jgi:hypothetical protein